MQMWDVDFWACSIAGAAGSLAAAFIICELCRITYDHCMTRRRFSTGIHIGPDLPDLPGVRTSSSFTETTNSEEFNYEAKALTDRQLRNYGLSVETSEGYKGMSDSNPPTGDSSIHYRRGNSIDQDGSLVILSAYEGKEESDHSSDRPNSQTIPSSADENDDSSPLGYHMAQCYKREDDEKSLNSVTEESSNISPQFDVCFLSEYEAYLRDNGATIVSESSDDSIESFSSNAANRGSRHGI